MYDYQALPYEAGRVVAFEREGKCIVTSDPSMTVESSLPSRLLTDESQAQTLSRNPLYGRDSINGAPNAGQPS